MRRRVVFTITVVRLPCDYRPSPGFSILTTLKKSAHGQHSAAVGVTSPFNPAAPEARLPSNNLDHFRNTPVDELIQDRQHCQICHDVAKARAEPFDPRKI